MAQSKKSYRYCFVPRCKNTTVKNPDKLFFNGPKDPILRKKWCTAARREQMLGLKTTFACCQDHFSLDEDVENIMGYKMGMVSKLFLKRGVIPHIFACQEENRSRHSRPACRVASSKRQRKSLVAEIISENITEVEQANKDCIAKDILEPVESNSVCSDDDILMNCSDENTPMNSSKDFSVQVNTSCRYIRSKAVQCSPAMTTVGTSPHKKQTPAIGSSKLTSESSSFAEEDIHSSSLEETSTYYDSEDADYMPSEECGGLADFSSHTLSRIKVHPRLYVGLPVQSYVLIEKLCEFTGFKEGEILLVLKKIRLNDQFEVLGHDFGFSKSKASRIFSKVLPVLANYLKGFIFWPSDFEVKMNLPIPFRARYAKVQSIIDCFEIEIEKPSNPVSQALTWSEYKKCNTFKYLLSCTPDGTVNFVSKGFGGRSSDTTVVENSGYLDYLPTGAWVMADRGFKHIESILEKKGCKLVRPPSVASGEVLCSKQVKVTKQIAGLRIHVERVISRLREFKYLVPHACLSHNLLSKTDDIVTVACAIINCQGRII